MAKTQLRESVVHEWVSDLPFQMQALLFTSMRGPDENNKHNPAKSMIRYMRGIVLKPAGNYDTTYIDVNDNDFMWGDYRCFGSHADAFFYDHDNFPHHFIMHLAHCAEIVGYKFKDVPDIAECWMDFYLEVCNAFHMNPETEGQLDNRLNDFGKGIHNEIIYRIYKDDKEGESSTILGAMQRDVTKGEYDKWEGSKEIINKANPAINNQTK
jgi:hypothetical protein